MSVKLLVPVQFKCDHPYCSKEEPGTCLCTINEKGTVKATEPALPPGWGWVKWAPDLYCPEHYKEYGS